MLDKGSLCIAGAAMQVSTTSFEIVALDFSKSVSLESEIVNQLSVEIIE